MVDTLSVSENIQMIKKKLFEMKTVCSLVRETNGEIIMEAKEWLEYFGLFGKWRTQGSQGNFKATTAYEMRKEKSYLI